MRLYDQSNPAIPSGLFVQAARFGVRLPAGEAKVKQVIGLSRKNRRGAAVVEFALVVPIFILLVFGMIEFGRAVMVQQVLVNATREGARQAVLDGSTMAEVQDRIDVYLAASSINGATTTVAPDPQTAAFGQPITVTISVPFANVSWLPIPQYIGDTTLTASSVMRRETSQ